MVGLSHSLAAHGAWEPGVSSRIPREFEHLETIHRAEHVFPGPDLVEDYARLTGLPHEELVMFRPARLALHEVIVRVTADISVAEGASEEAFGQDFRRIAGRILEAYVSPRMHELERLHEDLRQRASESVRAILDARLGTVPPPPRPRAFGFNLLRWKRRNAPVVTEASADREHSVVAQFKADAQASATPLDRALFGSLHRVLGAVLATRGRLGSDHAVLAELATRHVCNRLGSRLIGGVIAPLVEVAIETEGYTRVANRAAPLLISLKGASAAGKSSIRPMVKRLMLDSGIDPDDYATISPDVWRRLLLDYDSLGEAYKYAGHLTSRELVVIDAKLDRYIRDKAERGQGISHLLVDRFRFDSFSIVEIGRVLRRTYTKYVSTIHMYFIVTPPEETVERGWQRALERGRYKAVEDFLGHCVETYSGMPRVLFRWLGYRHVDYHFHFLDNRVPKGAFPTPIASGDGTRMVIYDPHGIVAIDRYQKIDIHARSRGAVYPPGPAMNTCNNLSFLRQCLHRIPVVTFFDGPEGKAWLEARNGNFEILDPSTFEKLLGDQHMAVIIGEIAPGLAARSR